jgi:hypothetical protein
MAAPASYDFSETRLALDFESNDEPNWPVTAVFHPVSLGWICGGFDAFSNISFMRIKARTLSRFSCV